MPPCWSSKASVNSSKECLRECMLCIFFTSGPKTSFFNKWSMNTGSSSNLVALPYSELLVEAAKYKSIICSYFSQEAVLAFIICAVLYPLNCDRSIFRADFYYSWVFMHGFPHWHWSPNLDVYLSPTLFMRYNVLATIISQWPTVYSIENTIVFRVLISISQIVTRLSYVYKMYHDKTKTIYWCAVLLLLSTQNN